MGIRTWVVRKLQGTSEINSSAYCKAEWEKVMRDMRVEDFGLAQIKEEGTLIPYDGNQPEGLAYAPNARVGRAYGPWAPEDDRLLLAMHKDGWSTRALSQYFNRSKGAIASRIRKLNIDCGACGMPMWRCSCDFGV